MKAYQKWLVVIAVVAALAVASGFLFPAFWNNWIAVPVDESDVTSVSLVCKGVFEGEVSVTITDTASFPLVTAAEKAIRQADGVNRALKSPSWSITLSYTLRSGRVITREYRGQMPPQELLDALRAIPEIKTIVDNAWREDPSIVASVNGTYILQRDIDLRRATAQLSLKNGLAQLDAAAGLTDDQKATMRTELQAAADRTDAEILDEIIAQTVLIQAAKAQVTVPNEADARKSAEETYFALRDAANAPNADDTAVQTYQVLLDYMEENNLSEEAYLEQATETYRDQMCVERLRDKLRAEGQEIDDAYVQALIDNAVIGRR